MSAQDDLTAAVGKAVTDINAAAAVITGSSSDAALIAALTQQVADAEAAKVATDAALATLTTELTTADNALASVLAAKSS